MFAIETYDARDGGWTRDGLEAANGANRFASEGEAEAAIESLRTLGSEWAASQYRVAEARD